MTKNKMKKIVGFLICTVMSFSLCLGIPQDVRAEEEPDPTEFAGATEIGNITWRDPGNGKEYNVYLNDTGYFLPANTEYSVPARGPAHISLNQAYKTRMNNVLGDRGSVYGPSVMAYYYFTLDHPASVTVYGQCSTASNSKLSIEKIDNIETFGPSTEPFGVMMGSDEVKALSVNLTAGNYLITLYWGMNAPVAAGTNNSYVKVIADYSINQEANSEWYETFPNNHIHSDPPSKDACKYYTTPYKIGKTMHGTTSVGNIDRTMKYTTGCYSFTVSERTQLNFESLENIYCAYVFSPSNDHNSNDNKITSMGNTMTLEPGDYILQVVTTARGAYSFRTSQTSVPPASVIAGVDTMAISGWSVSGEIVTIRNLSENSEFCIWSGDKDNAGYGKGNAKLVIQGNCYVKTLVIDCPVEVMCEPGAKLVVGDLEVHTTGDAGGKLTYTDGTTYNEATKTFEVSCTHTTQIIVGKKDATCTVTGYTGDTHCKACNVKLQSGSSIAALNHSYDEGVITTQPTTTTEGVKTFTCTRCGDTKTETVAKLPDNSDNNQNKAEKQITGFATRMYSVVLGRTPDEGGLDYWTNELKTGKMDGAALASGFIGSPEFTEKNLSDEDYLKVLYNTFFDREADEAGMAYWLGELQTGMPRTTVLAGFVNSKEFGGICEDSGIARGTMEPDGSSIYNEGVYKFVLRNYTKALDRKGEVDGVEYWSHLINTKQMTALDCAKSFFGSQEFINKNLSDEDYVETLYATYFGRESDAEGKAYWLSSMKSGMSRDVVLSQFAESKEFSTIMAEYGL